MNLENLVENSLDIGFNTFMILLILALLLLTAIKQVHLVVEYSSYPPTKPININLDLIIEGFGDSMTLSCGVWPIRF